jgi:hypothetical protein
VLKDMQKHGILFIYPQKLDYIYFKKYLDDLNEKLSPMEV